MFKKFEIGDKSSYEVSRLVTHRRKDKQCTVITSRTHAPIVNSSVNTYYSILATY